MPLSEREFDRLAAAVVNGTATPSERELFVSAAQQERTVLRRIREWIDRQIKAGGMAGRPVAVFVGRCAACHGTGNVFRPDPSGRSEAVPGLACAVCGGSGQSPSAGVSVGS
jgi:hypothetical protein